MQDLPIFPEQASTLAGQIDAIYFTLLGLSVFFGVAVAVAVIFLSYRYREGNDVDRSNPLIDSYKLELTWSIIPFFLALGIFGWAAVVFYNAKTPPADAIDVYVVGKQWMWHIQHPSGKSEINELHVPINQPVRLLLTSQDVIHNFFVPAFRIKQDAVPGRYTEMWFEATKTGDFKMFCAEYCGTEHSLMIGRVVVMEQDEYQNWLVSGAGGAVSTGGSLADAGAELFNAQGCGSCHTGDPNGLGPPLEDLFGNTETLENGETIEVDEAYLRTSILRPMEHIVQGYTAAMPTYEGQISEEGVLQLVEYIKSLSDNAEEESSDEGSTTDEGSTDESNADESNADEGNADEGNVDEDNTNENNSGGNADENN